MTVVSAPSLSAPPGGPSGLSGDSNRARWRDAAVAAAHQSVIRGIRGTSTGALDLPELGRVVVNAASVDGGVDVRVAAERIETHAVLHGSEGAIVADLRQGSMPIASLKISHTPVDGQAWTPPVAPPLQSPAIVARGPSGDGPFSAGQQGMFSGHNHRHPPDAPEAEERHPSAPSARRVRIVL